MDVRRCIVDNKLIWWRRLMPSQMQSCEMFPGEWVCGWECYKVVASAIDAGLGSIYHESA